MASCSLATDGEDLYVVAWKLSGNSLLYRAWPANGGFVLTPPTTPMDPNRAFQVIASWPLYEQPVEQSERAREFHSAPPAESQHPQDPQSPPTIRLNEYLFAKTRSYVPLNVRNIVSHYRRCGIRLHRTNRRLQALSAVCWIDLDGQAAVDVFFRDLERSADDVVSFYCAAQHTHKIIVKLLGVAESLPMFLSDALTLGATELARHETGRRVLLQLVLREDCRRDEIAKLLLDDSYALAELATSIQGHEVLQGLRRHARVASALVTEKSVYKFFVLWNRSARPRLMDADACEDDELFMGMTLLRSLCGSEDAERVASDKIRRALSAAGAEVDTELFARAVLVW
jgi:hypothetical protein